MSSQQCLLFVDDEPDLLKLYTGVFAKDYKVDSASDAIEALRLIEERATGPDAYAVIVTDLSMPGMDGIEFLDQTKHLAPDSVRIMLTGYASEESAIDAVNRGDVFRFLTKPIRINQLVQVIQEGVQRYQVLLAERELLEQTLSGSIEMLIEALSLASPTIFGRASRLRDDMVLLSEAIGLTPSWELETSAMLSQIGLLTAPDALIEKIMREQKLTQSESDTYRQQAQIGAELVRKVPRLNAVADNIELQYKNYDGSGFPTDKFITAEEIPLGARMLRVLQAMHDGMNSGRTRKATLQKMRESVGYYDPELMDALEKSAAGIASSSEQKVFVSVVHAGQVLSQDIFNRSGTLVMREGQELSNYLAEKLRSFASAGQIDDTIYIRTVESSDKSL